MKPLLSALALLLLGGCLAPRRYQMELPERHATLENGLRVVVLPDPTAELVHIAVRYDVGANEDPEGRAGLAHLVEHLMFAQRGAGADRPTLGAVLHKNAIYVNAETQSEHTLYEEVAAPDRFDVLVGLEAARLATGCNGIDQATFEREREVVRNELRLRYGSVRGNLEVQILQAAYPPGHPYRFRPGGTDAQVAAATLAEACRFVHDYYVPERATVIVVGAVTVARAYETVAQYLGGLPARRGAPRRPVPALALTPRRVDLELDVERPTVYALWPLPPRFSAEAMGADFSLAGMAGLLRIGRRSFGGDAAPLGGVVAEVTDDGKLDRVVQSLRDSANLLFVTRSPSDEELSWLVGAAMQRMESLAGRVGFFASQAGLGAAGGSAFAAELARLRDYGSWRVPEARARFAADKALVVVVRPRLGAGAYAGGASVFRPLVEGADADELPVDPGEAATSIDVPPATRSDSVRSFQLDNGLKVLLLPTSRSVPVVTISLVLGVGASDDPPEQPGLARLGAALLSSPLHKIRADVVRDVTEDSTTFTARGLSVFTDLLLRGVRMMVQDGGFQLWDRVDKHAYAARLGKRWVRRSLAAESTLRSALYGADHPYARSGLPDAFTIDTLRVSDLERFRTERYRPGNATLVVAGSFDPAKVEGWVRAEFVGWKGFGGERRPPPPVRPRDAPVHIGIEQAESAVVEVRVAFPAAAGLKADRAARLVLAEVLDRRMSALRERLAASYDAGAELITNVGPGAYLLGADVDPARAGEALKSIREDLERLRRGEGLLVDFVHARRAALKALLAPADTSYAAARRLTELVVHGLSPGFHDELTRAVGAVTVQEVARLINAELRPELEVIQCLGPHHQVAQAFREAGIDDAGFVKP
jgi:zinc protease